jgi:hypothetical protein
MEDYCFCNFVLPKAKLISTISKPTHAYLNAKTSPANPTVQAMTLPQKNFEMALMYMDRLLTLIEGDEFYQSMPKRKYK